MLNNAQVEFAQLLGRELVRLWLQQQESDSKMDRCTEKTQASQEPSPNVAGRRWRRKK